MSTVLNPLLHFHNNQLDIVLSVFADVRLLGFYLQGNKDIFYGNVNYIYQKQLEEADIIIVNKIDLLSAEQLALAKQLIEKEYRGKTILYQNSLSRESIGKWVDLVLNDYRNPNLRPSLQLDYDLYADGEAELAWLDEEMVIQTNDQNASGVVIQLVNIIYFKILQQKYPVGHLKFLINDGQKQRKISFSSIAMPELKQEFPDSKVDRISLLINARVQTNPLLLSDIVSDSIDEVEMSTCCKVIRSAASAFRPGYPRPTHRMQH